MLVAMRCLMLLMVSLSLLAAVEADQATVVHILQSSHQDIAWMDEPKVCRQFRQDRNLLPAMAQNAVDPACRFSIESAMYLQEALEDLPDRRLEILAQSRAGQLEWGATWTQPYEALLSGEQLVRSVLYAKGWLQELGIDSRVAFNFDVPSRARQMPQILAKTGVPYLATGRMPFGVFRWQAPDGSAVIAYSPGHYNRAAVALKKHRGGIDRWAIRHVRPWQDWLAQRQIPLHVPLLVSDDWSEPRQFAELVGTDAVPGVQFRYATVAAWLDAFMASDPALPSISGMRPNTWSYIHGPGHYQAIAAKRRAAQVLPEAEFLGVLRQLGGDDGFTPDRQALRQAWLDSMSDDHGWGGRNGAITDQTFAAWLARAEAAAVRMRAAHLATLAGMVRDRGQGEVVVVNHLSWPVSGQVACPLPPAGRGYATFDGRLCPQQRVGDDQVVQVTVPACGWQVLTTVVLPAAVDQSPPDPDRPGELGGSLVVGAVSDLTHRPSSTLLPTRMGELVMYHSPGKDAGRNFDVVPPKKVLATAATMVGAWQQVASGPLWREWLAVGSCDGVDEVQIRLRVHRLEPRLTWRVALIGWDGTADREFRLQFPIPAAGQPVIYEEPYAPVQVGRDEWRGPLLQKIKDPAAIIPREVQNAIRVGPWVLVPRVATTAISRQSDGTVVLAPILLASRRSCHREGQVYAQPGDHHFECDLLYQPGDWPTAVRTGRAITRGLRAVVATGSADVLPPSGQLLSLADDRVLIEAVKFAEDGDDLIVRLVSWTDQPVQTQLRCLFPISAAWRTDLMETNISPIEEGAPGVLNLGFDPHGIETIRLRRDP